jgi:tRNA (guanine-N7-)-methyltransferase
LLLDWHEIFGNANGVEVEIGCGKGMFLVGAAQVHSTTNFLGIEIERKYQLYTANRLAKRRLGNVRVACADARSFFRMHVPDQSVQVIHIYFPDPWWKKRHHKRRLFTGDFALQCARALSPGGRLLVVSDVADYFADIQHQLGDIATLELLHLPQEPQPERDCLTNFERKYCWEARPIHRAAYVKRSGPQRSSDLPCAAGR